MTIDLQKIPEAACRMAGIEIEMEANSDTAKTRKVRIQARSGQPIEHWYWGRVVHDLSGMRTHKPRLPIDYAHNDSEVLGYLNHFDATSGNLVASGALIPFHETDRASEVISKMDAGVPYEASIFFGGDGIRLQEVQDNERTQVNGYDFDGPGIVVREWPLRGVAICPYGADANTSSESFSSKKHFKAGEWRPDETGTQEVEQMSAKEEHVESAPDAEMAAEPVTTEAVDATTEQEASTEAVEVVEEPAVDQPEAEATDTEAEETQDERDEFRRMKADFGAEIAAEVFDAGGGYDEARTAFMQAIQAENEALKSKLAGMPSGGTPASFAQGENKKPTFVDLIAGKKSKG